MKNSDQQLLRSAASHLIDRLQVFDSSLRFVPDLKVESLPLINGGWITLAEWSRYIGLGISFDRCPGFEEPKFWVGFYSTGERTLRSFVDGLPSGLDVAMELKDKDFIQTDKQWRLKSRPSAQFHKDPVFESYKNGVGAYYGIYDVGVVGTKHELDVKRSAKFVSRVLEAVSGFDENAQGLEGAAKKKFVLHRKREIRLRNAKIQQAVKQNGGRLLCEVEHCGFDFKEKYGELGAGYAHVHHKKPLSNAPLAGTTVSLADLAVVCANCHAMIHKGGGCRPLKDLIPSPIG